MKALAILVLCMIACATTTPATREKRQILTQIAIVHVLDAINAALDLLIKVTFKLVTMNKIMPQEDVAKIMRTFYGSYQEGTALTEGILTAEAVDALTITGDAKAATVYRTALKKTINDLKNNLPTINLTSLEVATLQLLASNGAYFVASDLKQFFNVCTFIKVPFFC